MRFIWLLSILLGFLPKLATLDKMYAIEPGSKLVLDGTTNVNTFSCRCTDQEIRNLYHIRTNPHTGAASFEKTILFVRTKSLDCKHKVMNQDMYKALRANTYPQIRIELGEVIQMPRLDLSNSEEWQPCTVLASLTIADHTKSYPFHLKARQVSENRYRFICTRELKLSDFGIAPPCVLGGLVKVNDCVDINFDLLVSVQSGL